MTYSAKAMYFRVLFIVVILFIFSNNLVSQKSPFIKFYIFPIGTEIGDFSLSELGFGYYDFNYKSSSAQLGVFYFTNPSKRFNFKFGVNLKKLNYKFDYIITDPLDEEQVFTHENRYMKKIVISPNIGLNYKCNNFSFAVGIEPNMDLYYETNVISGRTPLYVFIDPVNQKSAQLRAAEKDFYINRLTYYLSPTFGASFELFPNFNIEFDAKIKPYGEWTIYRLNIDGRTSDMPEGDYPLNDTRISNRYVLLYFGVSYSIQL